MYSGGINRVKGQAGSSPFDNVSPIAKAIYQSALAAEVARLTFQDCSTCVLGASSSKADVAKIFLQHPYRLIHGQTKTFAEDTKGTEDPSDDKLIEREADLSGAAKAVGLRFATRDVTSGYDILQAAKIFPHPNILEFFKKY